MLWREFGLALPSSASLPRFDQRGDVTQLGAIVLAIGIRRSLRRDEYPRGTADLVNTVVLSDDVERSARIRQWLHDTLQLEGRVVFSTAVDAAQAFADVVPIGVETSEDVIVSLQVALQQLCGEPQVDEPSHLRAS